MFFLRESLRNKFLQFAMRLITSYYTKIRGVFSQRFTEGFYKNHFIIRGFKKISNIYTLKELQGFWKLVALLIFQIILCESLRFFLREPLCNHSCIWLMIYKSGFFHLNSSNIAIRNFFAEIHREFLYKFLILWVFKFIF